jgi:hypothetical protein
LWHRLDLDFMSNESKFGRLSAYTGDPACRLTDAHIPGARRSERTWRKLP